MNLRHVAVVGLAALVVVTGTVAAAPAAETTTEHAPNAEDTETPDARAPGNGPPTEMPDGVPDHVTEIHQTIQSFLDGSLDGTLGDALGDQRDRNGHESAGDAPVTQTTEA